MSSALSRIEIRHRFADADASDLRHHVVQALDMLNIERRVNVDAGRQQFLDIEVALGMAAAGRVRMGQLVHQRDLGATPENGVEVHLFKDVPVIVDLQSGNDFEAVEQTLRFRPPMRFHDAEDDVRALRELGAPRHKHFVSFADAGRRAEKHLQTAAAPVFATRLFEERVGRGSSLGVGLRHVSPRAAALRPPSL